MREIHNQGYRMYKAQDKRLPTNSYIICDPDAGDILYHPHIAGKELQDRMDKVSVAFMDAIGRTVLKGKKSQDITEMILLAGGLYYQLNHGFKVKYNLALPQCFLGIKRQRVEGSEGSFTAVATYENFESLPKNATVIIGDTIATGATIQKALYHLFDAIELRKGKIEDLVICSLACSVTGAMLLKEVEKRMERDFPGSRLHLFVAEEFFHLMPDGTDLRFLYDDAIIPDETRKRTLERYGEYLGKEMKCAVFDWGTRCKNPIAHYKEFLEFAHEMGKRKLDSKSKTIIERMEKETRENLALLEKPL